MAFSQMWVWWEKVLVMTSQGCNNEEDESRGIWRVSMWRLWISQSYFSLGFLSQFSLWKLQFFVGMRGIYTGVRMECVRFFKIELAGSLASQLDWIASSSREQTELPDWTFCPVVLQLAWLFIFSACFTRVHHLAACHPWVPVASPYYFAQLGAFLHTL